MTTVDTRLLTDYVSKPGNYDELYDGTAPRVHFEQVAALLNRHSCTSFARRQSLAELAQLNSGTTFSEGGDNQSYEKLFPFCLVPRPIAVDDFAKLERGLLQRTLALSLFLDDIYGDQRVVLERRLPAAMLLGAAGYKSALRGLIPPGRVRLHVAAADVIRDAGGTWRVLEDHLRMPFGASFVVDNRATSKKILPHVFGGARVRPVDNYLSLLADNLRAVAPDNAPENPTVVVLTSGAPHAGYAEHVFLARRMNFQLVQPGDLFVDQAHVKMRTIRGPQPVHVIYRQVDDALAKLDGVAADTMFGIVGLLHAYAAGNVTIANAPGNGIADDKVMYSLVPELIRFYLGEAPVLEQVPTYSCLRDDDRSYVLDHLHELVVQTVDDAGSYDRLMGPESTAIERDEFRHRILAAPRNFIAQPYVELSTSPTWIADRSRVEPRRVVFRPYMLTSAKGSWVMPGGLTRVAFVDGSYVVNSSNGGGSKDTWVLQNQESGSA